MTRRVLPRFRGVAEFTSRCHYLWVLAGHSLRDQGDHTRVPVDGGVEREIDLALALRRLHESLSELDAVIDQYADLALKLCDAVGQGIVGHGGTIRQVGSDSCGVVE